MVTLTYRLADFLKPHQRPSVWSWKPTRRPQFLIEDVFTKSRITGTANDDLTVTFEEVAPSQYTLLSTPWEGGPQGQPSPYETFTVPSAEGELNLWDLIGQTLQIRYGH